MTRKLLLSFAVVSIGLADIPKQLSPIQTLLDGGSAFLRAGEIGKAATAFRDVLASASTQNDELLIARARIGLAACSLVTHDYRAAIDNGEKAFQYGLRTHNQDIAVRAALNLQSVYRRMGDFAAAAQRMRALNPILPQVTQPSLKMSLYIHAASNAARNKDWERAEPMFYAGIDLAHELGDLNAAATAWNLLGYQRLVQKDYSRAETALIEAFRLRRLAKNRNLSASYTYLGMLRLAQGDSRSALNLINEAIEISSTTSVTFPVYVMYYWRAKSRVAAADTTGALADFDRAVQLATEWRQEVLPADGFRVSAEVGMDTMFADYVQTGMDTWAATKDEALARRMFEVSEQHRSASFRELAQTEKPLPPEYWEAVGVYRTALAASLASGKTDASSAARVNLTRIETSLGLEVEREGSAKVTDVQRRIGPDEALISFHTGAGESHVWAITRTTFEAHSIAGMQTIEPLAKQFREAIETGKPLSGADARLYDMLFGSLSTHARSKRDWLFSLDHGLYDIPYAALGDAKAPMILSHSLRTIPGATLLHREVTPVKGTQFTGAGDAIYNSADPRWKGKRRAAENQFARLINTRKELRTVSQAWTADSEPTLLLGEAFNRASLEEALRSQPAVVHIAAHVVRSVSDAANVMIGIGLGSDGNAEFLTPSDITARGARLGLVSINGCASGSGESLPGAGLVGLTRAWLLGGATAVAATYWPVTDDRGELFAAMYRELARSENATITASRAARALQTAQIEALRSGGPQARPGYWAAVFLAGKR